MLAKTREKLVEFVFMSLVSGFGLIIIRTFARGVSAENLETIVFFAEALVALLILGLIVGLTLLQPRRFKPGLTLQPTGIVRPEVYFLSPGRVSVYGTLLFVAGTLVLNFIAGLSFGLFTGAALGASGTTTDIVNIAINIISLLAQAFSAYLVGRWIGARAVRYGYVVLLAAVLIGRVVMLIIDMLLGITYIFDGLFIIGFFIFTILVLLFGGIGCWLGIKGRQAGYIWYLLSRLPTPTRESLEGLLYEEILAQSQENLAPRIDTGDQAHTAR